LIFVDTGGWVAYVLSDDQYHTSATRWMHLNQQPLITTDYVIDEALTLLKARGEPVRAQQPGLLLFGSNSRGSVHVHYLTQEDILDGWQVFYSYIDKEWGFTDCTSKIIIEKFGIQQAFAFDHHFRQFGTVIVVP
jgi:predicted nucleic acid-binding protein